MKKEIICGIYKITSPTGRVYIGQSLNILKYRKEHYERCDCEGQPKLCNSIKKYGWEYHTFEIIEECEFDELNCRERHWQDFYDVLNGGLNCTLVSCDDIKHVTSDETKRKMSESRTGIKRSEETIENIRQSKLGDKNPMYGKTGKLNPNYGKPLSEEHKQQLRERPVLKGVDHPWFGKNHSEETKEHLSRIRKGTNQGDENPWFGRTHSDETKEKMSIIKKENQTESDLKRLKEISAKGVEKFQELLSDEEYLNNFKDACSIAQSKYSFLQIDMITGIVIKEFETLRDIKKEFIDVSISTIHGICKGKGKSHKGFTWKRRCKATGVVEVPTVEPKKRGNRKETIDKEELIVYNSCTEAEKSNGYNRSFIANKLGYNKNNTPYQYLEDFLKENPDFDTSKFIYHTAEK